MRYSFGVSDWRGLIAIKPNAAAAKELRKSIQFYFTNKRIIYLIGVFRDKEYEQVIENNAQ